MQPNWASLKFWRRHTAAPKRRIRLGVDYGVSTSKVVFRHRDPSGGESAQVVLHDGCLQIPSRVSLTATAILFGRATIPGTAYNSYESLKTRIATEVTASAAYQLVRTTKLAGGFSATELGTLTVWFLISKAHQAVATQFKEQMEGIEFGMTMGVPTEFLNNQDLKATFLGIARQAWLFYCNEGVIDCEVPVEQARRVLDKYPPIMSTLPEEEAREWIRREADASLWMVLHSPSVPAGPYALVDIGAGWTHTSLFRIFGKVHTIKRSLAPFGSGAVPIGMDAVDLAIAEGQGFEGDYTTLRGSESSILQANEKVRDAVRLVCNRIYDSYRLAWNEAFTKLSSNPLELIAWRQHKVVLLGGGSLVSFLGDTIRTHPDDRELLPDKTLEQPHDLVRPDRRNLTSEELKLASVAYGLSKNDFHVPNPYCRNSM
jgi:hypothetical protein